ncbi:MAG TPA: hypothetical protein VIF88_04885 [Methylocystis sp.]|jgi:hypothetical protein
MAIASGRARIDAISVRVELNLIRSAANPILTMSYAGPTGKRVARSFAGFNISASDATDQSLIDFDRRDGSREAIVRLGRKPDRSEARREQFSQKHDSLPPESMKLKTPTSLKFRK